MHYRQFNFAEQHSSSSLTRVAAKWNTAILSVCTREHKLRDARSMTYVADRSESRYLLMRLQHNIHKQLLKHGGEYPCTLCVNTVSQPLETLEQETHEIIQGLISLLLGSHAGSSGARRKNLPWPCALGRCAVPPRAVNGVGPLVAIIDGWNTCDHTRQLRSAVGNLIVRHVASSSRSHFELAQEQIKSYCIVYPTSRVVRNRSLWP